jgi:hypothetical protein
VILPLPITLRVGMLTAAIAAAEIQGCWRSIAPATLISSEIDVVPSERIDTRPVIETFVAQVTIAIGTHQGLLSAGADVDAVPAYALTMPAGQPLIVGVAGIATWSDGADGRARFCLAIQRRVSGEWVTVDWSGVGGARQGPFEAQGHVCLPIVMSEVGRHRVRAVIAAVVESPEGQRLAEDRDSVEFDIDVIPSTIRPNQQMLPSLPARSDQWLQPEPPDPNLLAD